MAKIGIVGGTGYTGVELMRLLSQHSEVTLEAITSRSNAGQAVADLFTGLRGQVDLDFTDPGEETFEHCDLVFFATPNKVAMHQVDELLNRGIRVIDLAADFRLKDLDVWSQWYGDQHACPEWVEKSVYGLPEMNRERIKNARLIANPGCYVTAVTLPLMPLLKDRLILAEQIIADCKSGVSGAGRSASLGTAFAEVTESVKAYAVSGHRHYPEIKQNLREVEPAADLVFVPHLMPMIRGIQATIYVVSECDIETLQQGLETYYENEPFVDVMPLGSIPETRSVKGANFCRIAIHQTLRPGQFVILSVIDNLVKGAAGQAVQNMNLMLGYDESTGLGMCGLTP